MDKRRARATNGSSPGGAAPGEADQRPDKAPEKGPDKGPDNGSIYPPPEQPRWLPRDDQEVPPRPALTRRRIVMTALGLVEEHGLDALTMRRVASALHVTPMSLYNHVSDKAELVDLMVDFIIGDVVAKSADDVGDWDDKLRALVRRNHQMWRDHPGFVRVYAEGVTLGPNGLANCELTIAILREAGLSDEEAGGAFLMLYRWSMATLLVAPTRPVNRSHHPLPPGFPRSKRDRLGLYFSALPVEEIPNIEATVTYLAGTSIEFGLETIIAGLKSRLATTAAIAAEGDQAAHEDS